MKKSFFKVLILFFLFSAATPCVMKAQDKDEKKIVDEYANLPILVVNGTNSSAVFTIDAKDLQGGQDIQLKAPNGFTVSPASIPASSGKTKVTVTLNSTKNRTIGKLIIRSGDIRKYLKLEGYGTALSAKDISASPVYKGKDATFVKDAKQGFNPTDKGYTVEFKVKTDEISKVFSPYFVDANGYGLKIGINSGEGQYDTGISLYTGESGKSIANPFTSVEGGRGRFYNTDGKSHVYRFTVTPDNRLFVFRDGLAVDTVRLADFGSQPDFAVKNGEPVENLLRNPGFEGEYDAESNGGLLKSLEGWNIAITDRWCSEQYIVNQELDNEQDFNNHILRLRPYKWAGSWGDPQIIQIVDVAPNETYTLSALAKGGVKKKEGVLSGKIFIDEVQNKSKKAETEIAGDNFETYSLDFTTSAEAKQIRVVFHIGGGQWGEDISPLEVDNVKLTGVSRVYSPKIGFENKGAELEYFTYDLSGAYAPVQPEINIDLK